MSDPLYLSFWFSSFEADDMLPLALSMLRQFPYSAQKPGITYLSLHPVSWNEATVLERRLDPGVTPEGAILMASEFIHEDYGYAFDAFWDLWARGKDGIWQEEPTRVRFLVNGIEFDDGAYEQEGHIQVELGLDSLFLQEQVPLTPEAEERVRANVQMLVDFGRKAEKTTGAKARLLWSESEENLAQKLIARLQKLQ